MKQRKIRQIQILNIIKKKEKKNKEGIYKNIENSIDMRGREC